jgi:hypothetical protein
MFSKYGRRVLSALPIKKALESTPARIDTSGRDAYKEFTEMATENIPTAVEVLKEMYPRYNFNNDVYVSNLIKHEFECTCTPEQVREARSYYEPPEQTELELLYRHCLE